MSVWERRQREQFIMTPRTWRPASTIALALGIRAMSRSVRAASCAACRIFDFR